MFNENWFEPHEPGWYVIENFNHRSPDFDLWDVKNFLNGVKYWKKEGESEAYIPLERLLGIMLGVTQIIPLLKILRSKFEKEMCISMAVLRWKMRSLRTARFWMRNFS